MTAKALIRAEAERLFAAFQAAGAVSVEADLLLPAETLLDLYGEDIRARAYVTNDPLRGEMMLRPDFTVPVVQAHMAHGADPARYCYMGEVFRKQDHLGNRASEYLQVGFEVFDRAAPEAAGDAAQQPCDQQPHPGQPVPDAPDHAGHEGGLMPLDRLRRRARAGSGAAGTGR